MGNEGEGHKSKSQEPETSEDDSRKQTENDCNKWSDCSFLQRMSFSTKGQIRKPATFKLTEDCKLVIQGGDITKWYVDGKTDAIVNAANEFMLGGGGVDGAIHRAAGDSLYEVCTSLPIVAPGVRCPTGEAIVTPGFSLPVLTIIHTVGPIYHAEECAQLLKKAYKNTLILARGEGVKYIAFPAISCGIYGYPAEEAAKIALDTVKEESKGFSEIHFVLFETPVWKAWLSAANEELEKIEDGDGDGDGDGDEDEAKKKVV